MAMDGRCLSPFSAASLDCSVVAKGLREAMRPVGSEGTHCRACPKEGCCCCGVAAAAAAIVVVVLVDVEGCFKLASSRCGRGHQSERLEVEQNKTRPWTGQQQAGWCLSYSLLYWAELAWEG